ncbi:hypothetical protein, unlikely [Trypanosoma brucei gambiense DAL972]|uniref:Uncharacterized protein n=1 Tax=Trypanosoma brucei gambiense (strain MHOM/CI/86/DAL972) TaxID=679716 RepID=C9ZSX4_TRYB9|nr:hypothetical protein, unlikely [Trypanosoma brucei gambiense DAL972]CBH12509.1 hypothetical protein, unlikely [Trypanosoma brucei gambiense DAL972]|eukprot:XP_011774789.1 hypothetical protein, unlikely [Trypanosoma brucei gambiense DAL972]
MVLRGHSYSILLALSLPISHTRVHYLRVMQLHISLYRRPRYTACHPWLVRIRKLVQPPIIRFCRRVSLTYCSRSYSLIKGTVISADSVGSPVISIIFVGFLLLMKPQCVYVCLGARKAKVEACLFEGL